MGPYKQQLTLSCESSWWRSRESYCQWWTVWWRYEELRRDLSLFKGKGELHMGPLQPLVTWEPENTGDTTTIFQPLKQLESSQHRQTLILPNLDFHFSSNFPSPLSFLHISSHNNHFNYLRANQVNFFISLFLMIKFLFVSDFLFEDAKYYQEKYFPHWCWLSRVGGVPVTYNICSQFSDENISTCEQCPVFWSHPRAPHGPGLQSPVSVPQRNPSENILVQSWMLLKPTVITNHLDEDLFLQSYPSPSTFYQVYFL